MGPIAQFLTGAFPALFGGAMANNDTAAGYSMARDQAMGRIGLVWRRMKFFHADMMLLAVDCFRRNRPNDVEVTLLGAGAAFESKWIRLADLKGNLFSYPETDEQYPTLWSQQRAVLLQLMANPDPQIQSVLAHPENMALIKRMIGLEEFVIPDEESRTKQYREIAQMVGEAPVVKRDDAKRRRADAAEHHARRIRGQSRHGAGNLHALVFVRRGPGGEDRSPGRLRKCARPRHVPPRIFAEAAARRSTSAAGRHDQRVVTLKVFLGEKRLGPEFA